jgi:hypothetical protein
MEVPDAVGHGIAGHLADVVQQDADGLPVPVGRRQVLLPVTVEVGDGD